MRRKLAPRVATLMTLLLLALPAHAEPPAAAPDDSSATLDEIVVTGTHMRGIDVETQHPFITLDRAAIDRTGLSNVAEIAQLVVANGPTANRNINNGSNGEQLINLRNLNFNRTLVLLNGQRFVSDINGAVDLSAIPLALVERIEVLLDGASATYGSDAIAGVINIVTRRKFDGAEFGAYYGQNDHDDGERRAYDLTFGRSGEKWSASVGIEWTRDDPIFAANRAISAVPVFGLPPGATGSTVTPYSWLRLDSGARVRLIDGRLGTSPNDFRPVDSNQDRYNYAPQTYLQTPQERRAVFAQARYEFSGTLAANLDVLYNERRSNQQLAPSVLHFNAFDASAANGFVIPAEDLYNPFGQPVIRADRRLVEAGPRLQDQTVGTLRVHAGIDGLLRLFDREFLWGADVIGTRARETDSGGPYGDNSKLVLALGPSFRDVSGTPRCGTPAVPIQGCVPLDLFGPPGSITPAMLAYATAFETNRTQDDSRVLEVHVTADRLVELPAGPLAFAAGIDHRRESGADMPDPLLAGGNENGNGSTFAETTRGAYSVSEAYLELDAPLLAEKPFVHKLDFVVGTRFSHYSNFGDTTNSQAGLRWRPIEDLLVRANYAHGFRAPAISELYRGANRGLAGAGLGDPCDPASEFYGDAAARCAALGVPAAVDSSTQLGAVTNAGNPQLRPETSSSRGLGVVYAPAWLEGFDFGIDWYDVRVREAVYYPGPQTVVDGCYLFHSDADCALITRDPADGTIADVISLPQNLSGGYEASGYDIALHWRHELGSGRLRLDATANHVLYLGEIGRPAPGAPLPDGSVAYGNEAGLNFGGLYGETWRWRSQVTLTWERAAWSASIGARYFSHLDESCDNVVGTAQSLNDPSLLALCSSPNGTLQFGDILVSKNRIPSVTFTDLNVAWDAPWHARVSVGVRNALDRNPPVSYSAGLNSFLADYDVPGRFFYASYRQKF